MIEPVLHIRYHVVAYDASYGGYGDDRSQEFTNGTEAIEYAKSIIEEKKKYPSGPSYQPTVWKRITMDPISIQIEI